VRYSRYEIANPNDFTFYALPLTSVPLCRSTRNCREGYLGQQVLPCTDVFGISLLGVGCSSRACRDLERWGDH
jgi:hypothetical protein